MPIYGLGDLVIVNPSSWKMSSDLTVASHRYISNRELGVEFSWAPPAGLIDTAREAPVKAVPVSPCLVAYHEGELFDRPEEVYARLQGYALGTGFAVARGQGSTPKRKNFWCIHHGTKTQNNRKSHDKTTKRSMLGVEIAE